MPATPEPLATYLAQPAAAHKVSTLQLRPASISQAHQMKEVANPADSSRIQLTMQCIRRVKRTTPEQVAPIMVSDLRRIIDALPDTLLGIGDKALLLLGFAGAFRRSGLVALDVSDIEYVPKGMRGVL